MAKELGKVRRAQVLFQGPGAVVDFRTEESPISAIIGGIDDWPKGHGYDPNYIYNNELAKLVTAKIQTRFKDPDPDFKIEYFRSPPVESSDSEDESFALDAFRFPTWLWCPNCNQLKSSQDWRREENTLSLSCSKCSRGENRVYVIPTRFMISCENGHLDDFPWKEWLIKFGSKSTSCDHNNLYLRQKSGDSSLKGQVIECEDCNSKASLENFFSNDYMSTISCKGKHPHLRNHNPEECTLKVKGLLKGASNSYFPVHESVISIPPYEDRFTDFLGNFSLQVILESTEEEAKMILNGLHSSNPSSDKKDFDYYWGQYLARKKWFDGKSGSHLEQEYERLQDDFSSEEIDSVSKDFEKKMIVVPESLDQYIEKIAKITKLKEVKALMGFKRLNEPSNSSNPGKGRFAPVSKSLKNNWLPAIEIFGEGIFFSIKTETLERWEADPNLKKRAKVINDEHKRNSIENLPPYLRDNFELDPIVSPRFLLLHSLSHAIMNQLALDCGYSVSSLKERLYISEKDSSNMAGILIYTSSSDSEGTLGSLSEKAEIDDFEHVFKEAIFSQKTCSDDPNCIDQISSLTEPFNHSACHSCLVLPENCCIHFNKFLDRALQVGNQFSIQESENLKGFFEDLLGE